MLISGQSETGDGGHYCLNNYYFRDWEDDVRLMILMIVSSFIILSLISIIGITTCVLLCYDDDIDIKSQNMEYLMEVMQILESKNPNILPAALLSLQNTTTCLGSVWKKEGNCTS